MFALAWVIACVVVGAWTDAGGRLPLRTLLFPGWSVSQGPIRSVTWLSRISLRALIVRLCVNAWHGGLAVDQVSGVGAGGAGVFARESGQCWFRREWGHLDLLRPGEEAGVEQCRLLCCSPGPHQTVQRVGMWLGMWAG